MIIAIGSDLVKIPRINRAWQRFGMRLLLRLLTVAEITEWQQRNPATRAKYLASRFAAKEAAAKALGTGIACGVSWRDFEIRLDKLGKPSLHLSGKAHALAKLKDISTSFVSLSDDGDYALAFVVMQ